MARKLIALDWGTTSLRAWRYDSDGQPLEKRESPWGIRQLPVESAHRDDAFYETLRKLCDEWLDEGNPAIIACGMVGSAQGWREAAYAPCPATPDVLVHHLTDVARDGKSLLKIVPGVNKVGALPEVMRGEETQIVGALIADDTLMQANRDGQTLLIGLPGTHSKWAFVQNSSIVDFHTFMTGEVYSALSQHTLLGATFAPADAPCWDAFDEGLQVAAANHQAGLLSTIFSTRTRYLCGQLQPEQQADYLSGLLIGHELCGLETCITKTDNISAAVALIGSDALCARYQRAFSCFHPQRSVRIIKNATEKGLWHIAQTAGLLTNTREL